MADFKWHKGEHDDFYNKIKRFNNKIKKAEKEGYRHDLPPNLNYKTELNKILSQKKYSREDFNKGIKYIDNFLDKKALDIKKGTRGAKIPVWEIKKVKSEVKEINRKRMIQKHKFEDEEATDRGKGMGVKVKDLKDVVDLATNKIREKKFNWKRMSTTDFEKFKETLWEFNQSIEDMDKQMLKNYKQAIVNEMDLKDSKALLRMIEGLPRELIIKKIYNDINLGFKFVYSGTDYENRIKALKQAWKQIGKDYQKTSEQLFNIKSDDNRVNFEDDKMNYDDNRVKIK